MLKVEPPRHPVHIQEFTHQIQTGLLAALHRRQVHLTKRNAPCRHEFLAEGAPPGNGQPGITQRRYQ